MPRKKHDFTGTEIKAGIFFIAAVAVFILFFGVVTNQLPRATGKTFVCYFQDTGGLDAGADVRYGGYKVGRVTAIQLDPEDQSRIRVELTVDETVPVNEDSEVLITSVTLTSARHVEIRTGSSAAPLLAAGSVIPAKDGGLFTAVDVIADRVAGLLEDVQALVGVAEYTEAANGDTAPEELTTVAQLFKSVDTILLEGEGLAGDIRGIVSDRRPDIDAVFESIRGVAETAQEVVSAVDEIVGENRDDIRATVANVRSTTEELGPIMAEARAVAERVDALADALQQTLDFAVVLTGDAAGLLGDNRAAVDDLVHELGEATRYLKLFARTLAERPQSLVLGRGN